MTQGRSPHLTPTQKLVFDAVNRAAEAGLPCPSNTVFLETCNCGISQGSEVLKSLEARGLIKVERGNSTRVVTILATGKRTAGEITNQHWRDRPENRAKVEARAGGREQSKREPVAPLTYVDRDPCFYCGSRKDVCMCGGSTGLRGGEQ